MTHRDPHPSGHLRNLEAAHITARAAWLHPDDHEQRAAAVIACDVVNVDYLETIARYMEQTDARANFARRKVAEALRIAADKTYEQETKQAEDYRRAA